VDLNYLYHRHQVSLFMADNAASGEARRVHRELGECYARRIAEAKLSRMQLKAA
jgi:hypothetical protein